MLTDLRHEWCKHRGSLLLIAAAVVAVMALTYATSFRFLTDGIVAAERAAIPGIATAMPTTMDVGISMPFALHTALTAMASSIGMVLLIVAVLSIVVRDTTWRTAPTMVAARSRRGHAAAMTVMVSIAVCGLLATAVVTAVAGSAICEYLAARRWGVAAEGAAAPPDLVGPWAIVRPLLTCVASVTLTVLVTMLIGLVVRAALPSFLVAFGVLMLPTEIAGQVDALRTVALPSLAQARLHDAGFTVSDAGFLTSPSASAGTVASATVVVITYSLVAAGLVVLFWRRAEIR